MYGNQVSILYKDENFWITSNYDVIDAGIAATRGEQAPVATMFQSDVPGVGVIVGNHSNMNIATFDTRTNKVTYLSNINKVGTANTLGVQLNAGNSLGITDGIGAVHTGGVSMDMITGVKEQRQTADVSKPMQPVSQPEPVEDPVYDMIDGYKFDPVPTSYSKVVLEPLSNTTAKYKILLKGNIMDNNDPHNLIYTELNNNANKKEFTLTEVKDEEVSLNNDFVTYSYMLSEHAGDLAIMKADLEVGFYAESMKVENIKNYDGKPYTTIHTKPNVGIVNKLKEVATMSSDFFSWLEVANKVLDNIQKASIKKHVINLILDHCVSIENLFELDYAFDPFAGASDLKNIIDSNVTDLILKGKYNQGFNTIYKRLTNEANIEAYADVLLSLIDAKVSNVLYSIGGIKEVVPLVVSRDRDVDTELSTLTSALTESSFYKVTSNTPNTEKLLNSLLNNSLKNEKKEYVNLMNYSTIGNNGFYLLVRSCLLRVVSTENGCLIRVVL